MNLNGVIYFYCPKESDLKDRGLVREYLCRPTTGRVFLQTDENYQWTIPFASTTQLISIFNQVRIAKIDDPRPDFTSEEQNFASTKNSRKLANDRRCLRISIDDIDAAADPMCHAHYLGEEGLAKQQASKFSAAATGVFIALDSKEDFKFRKIYFTDMFDAGIQLDKMFTREVVKRIPVKETINVLYDTDFN